MVAPDPGRDERLRKMRALLEEAQGLVAQLAAYHAAQAQDPAAGWPDIEWQADLNRELRQLRDRVLQLGEYGGPPAR